MQASRATQELEDAINALEGIYQTPSEPCRRQSQADAQRQFSVPSEYPTFDKDIDYDTPRPAEGLFNAPLQNTGILHDIPAELKEENHEQIALEIYRTVLPRPSKSPSTESHRSKESSGLGTLPRHSSIRIPSHLEFPGPPESTPSPPLHSDSDYDEVASISDTDEGTFNHKSQFESKTPVEGPVYSVVRKHADRQRHAIDSEKTSRQSDDDDPDYDDPWSVPNSQRASVAVSEKAHDMESNVKIPINNFSCPPFPVDEAEEIASLESATSGPSNSAAEPSNLSSPSKHEAMSAQSTQKKGPSCPCECRAALPLMTTAVLLCVGLLIGIVVGYIYFGMQVEEYLENAKQSTQGFKETTAAATTFETGSGSEM